MKGALRTPMAHYSSSPPVTHPLVAGFLQSQFQRSLSSPASGCGPRRPAAAGAATHHAPHHCPAMNMQACEWVIRSQARTVTLRVPFSVASVRVRCDRVHAFLKKEKWIVVSQAAAPHSSVSGCVSRETKAAEMLFLRVLGGLRVNEGPVPQKDAAKMLEVGVIELKERSLDLFGQTWLQFAASPPDEEPAEPAAEPAFELPPPQPVCPGFVPVDAPLQPPPLQLGALGLCRSLSLDFAGQPGACVPATPGPVALLRAVTPPSLPLEPAAAAAPAVGQAETGDSLEEDELPLLLLNGPYDEDLDELESMLTGFATADVPPSLLELECELEASSAPPAPAAAPAVAHGSLVPALSSLFGLPPLRATSTATSLPSLWSPAAFISDLDAALEVEGADPLDAFKLVESPAAFADNDGEGVPMFDIHDFGGSPAPTPFL